MPLGSSPSADTCSRTIFPDVVNEIGAHGGTTLGMSYEITRVEIPDQDAADLDCDRVYLHWGCGAAAGKAAYPQTWIALARAGAD